MEERGLRINACVAGKVEAPKLLFNRLLIYKWDMNKPTFHTRIVEIEAVGGIKDSDIHTKENLTCKDKRIIWLWNLLNNWIGS